MNYLKKYNDMVRTSAVDRAVDGKPRPFLALITFDNSAAMNDLLINNPKLFDDQTFAITRQKHATRPLAIDTLFAVELTADSVTQVLFCGSWIEYLEGLKSMRK